MDLRARADDAELVRAAQAGDGHAFGLLFDRWSTRVVDVAYRIVRDREVAAEVAQDAFLAAWTGLDRLEQVESFGGWVLRIGRNRALNRLERERRSVPVGDQEATEVLDPRADPGDEAGDAAARSEDAELVWAAAAALGPRDASVLDLHLRHGLAAAEIAEELGVTANAAHQVLFRLRARLGDAVRACVLWRAGHPACPDLAGVVATAGIDAFGAAAVRVITDHAEGCGPCARRQEGRLSPEALFAAVPLMVVAPEVLAAIRSGLADAGVPIDVAPPADAAGEAVGEAAGRAIDGANGGAPGSVSARRPALLATAAGVLVLVVVTILLLGDDGSAPEEIAVDGTTTSTTAPRSTAGEPSTSTTERPSSSSTTTTTTPGVSSLPAPTPPVTTTTGPSADIGTTTEPGLTPNPTTTRPMPTPTTAAPPPTTTAPSAPDPPRIISFSGTRIAGPGCATPSQRVALAWRTAGADDVRITGPGAPGGSLPAFGTAAGCSPGPGAYTLTASGPGGSVSRTVTVPG